MDEEEDTREEEEDTREEEESRDEEASTEMAPKKLRIRGEAQVPDESKEPATEDEKWLLVPGKIENFTYTGKNVRVPGSLIGAAIRKYWPGMYTPVLGGESKLAYTWEDYEIAPYPGFTSAADAVIKKFWRNYRVATEHKDRADVVLRNMCRKLTRQQWYNQRITCIGHFYAEQGVRYTKPEIVQGLAPAMTIDDFMSVVPHWADNNKRAAFMELVKNWVGENPDFKAVSDRNKANRGSQGTHTAGSSSTDRYRERLGKKLGRELGEMEAWTHMKLVTPGPNEPRPAHEMYYGKAKENKERSLRGPHGRPACLLGGFKPQRNFTQIKATLPSGSYATSSRTTCRSRVEVDTQLEEAYAVAYEEYLEKIKEHDLVKDAYVQWTSNQMASFTRFMMTGVREEPLPEPPHPGPTPVFPSKEEFYIMYKRQRQLTPGLGESGNDTPCGTPMHPGRHSPGASAEPRHFSGSGGSRRGSTSPSTVEIQRPHFTDSELARHCS
ncbi:uncharacterized protein [Lolium perenne]|uniref:uncharacterized protein n=1 Tax=Lolium perenne TaxID=4522 RepID=UPI003A99CD4A